MWILVWVHVCTVPPITVGVWLMVRTLWWLFENYYYDYTDLQSGLLLLGSVMN